MTGTGHRDIFLARSEKVKNYFVRRGSHFKIFCNRGQVFMIIPDTKIDKSVKDVKAFFHRIQNRELTDKEYNTFVTEKKKSRVQNSTRDFFRHKDLFDGFVPRK